MLLRPTAPATRTAQTAIAALVAFTLARQAWALLPAASVAGVWWVKDLIPIPVNLLSGAFCLWVGGQRAVDARASWRWVGAAMLAFALGDGIYAAIELRGGNPFPSAADLCYLACEIMLLVGFVLLPRPAFRRLEITRVVLNVAIIVLGIAMLIWYTVLGHAVQGHHGQWVPLAVSLIYPAFNLGLFSFLLLYLLRTRRFRLGPEIVFLSLGLAGLIVADASYVWRCFSAPMVDANMLSQCLGLTGDTAAACYTRLQTLPQPQDWALAAGWQWAATSFALAAFWDWRDGISLKGGQDQERLQDFETIEGIRTGFSRWVAQYGMYVAVVLVFALYATSRGETGLPRLGVEVGSSLMILLVVVRQFVALEDNRRLTDELRALSATLEERVADRTRELERSRAQLLRARELEEARNGVLEMIARDEPLPGIQAALDRIAAPSHATATAVLEGESRERLWATATARFEMIRALERQANFDALTGLPNRVFVQHKLDALLHEAAQAGDQPLAVMFVDLDRFKQINDTLGHPLGDRLLAAVAVRFQATLTSAAQAGRISPRSVLGRTGGDEFVVVLPTLEREAHATQLGEDLVRCLEKPILIDEHELFVEASVGVALSPEDGTDASTLQKHADTAMYEAKRRGLGVARFSPSMNADAEARLALERDLRHALERGELTLHYQPMVSLHDGEITGFEALLRWTHGKLGPVSPAQFIPVAEESGLIVSIGEWVLREACRQNAAWQARGLPPVKVAVNISALQFERSNFVATVKNALEDTGLDGRYLELELLEGMLLHQWRESAERMRELRSIGVRVAMDDFGTGYSSLSYLQRLPIDTLKIDRSFVRALDAASFSSVPDGATDLFEMASRARPLLESIVALARTLQLEVVAEGVETGQQRQALFEMGCATAQGFLFSPPRPPEVAAEQLGAGLVPKTA